MQCVSCFALPRTDPQVDRKFSQGLLNSIVGRRVRQATNHY